MNSTDDDIIPDLVQIDVDSLEPIDADFLEPIEVDNSLEHYDIVDTPELSEVNSLDQSKYNEIAESNYNEIDEPNNNGIEENDSDDKVDSEVDEDDNMSIDFNDNGKSGYYCFKKDNLPLLNNGELQVIKKIGRGRFSTVVECVNTQTKQLYAVKMYRSGSLYRKNFDNEIYILDYLKSLNNHPYFQYLTSYHYYFGVVSFYDRVIFPHTSDNSHSSYKSSMHPCVVFDKLCSHLGRTISDLYAYKYPEVSEPTTNTKKRNKGDSEPECFVMNRNLLKSMLSQITKGLHLLHNNGIVHTDIKLENILCCSTVEEIIKTNTISIKLADLGSSTFENKLFNRTIGTLENCSPEALFRIKYTVKTDIWSLGCIVYEIVTDKLLFDVLDECISDSESEESESNDEPINNLKWDDDSSDSSHESSDEADGGSDSTYRHLILMEQLLGVMPKVISRYGREFFNARGKLKNSPHIQPISFKQKLTDNATDLDKKTIQLVSKFMQACIQYLPQDRSSTTDLLNHPLII